MKTFSFLIKLPVVVAVLSFGPGYAALPASTPLPEGSELLYDIDFSAPEHTIGQMPASGSGPKKVSEIVFGTPTVRQSSVGLMDRPVEFDAVTSYEQFELQIPKVASSYRIEFDVASHGLRNSQYAFSVLLDTPEVRTVSLHGGLNTFQIWQPGAGFGSNTTSFQDDQVYHVMILVNLLENYWEVSTDGIPIFTHAFEATVLDSVRFNLSPWIGGAVDGPAIKVALDNIRITAETAVEVDRTRPRLAVKGDSRREVRSSSIVLSGTAKDNVAMDRVEVRTQGRPVSKIRMNGSRWHKVLALKPGINLFRVRAVDSAENFSAAKRIVVVRKSR